MEVEGEDEGEWEDEEDEEEEEEEEEEEASAHFPPCLLQLFSSRYFPRAVSCERHE